VIHPAPRPKKPAKKRHQWNSTIPASKVSSAPKVRPPKRKVAKRKIQKSSTRKAKNWGRAYGSRERVEWVKQQPCEGCLYPLSENAHAATGGTGRKSDSRHILPLCSCCHRALHRLGKRTWQARWLINLDAAAAETERRWQEHLQRKSA
jgi:hypothetical protein